MSFMFQSVVTCDVIIKLDIINVKNILYQILSLSLAFSLMFAKKKKTLSNGRCII